MLLRTCLTVALLAAASSASARVKLDGFLDGIIENACAGSADFREFKESLRSRYDVPVPEPRARAFIPDAVRPAIGKARIAEEDSGYRQVRVPLSGTFRGLSVSEIGFDFGMGRSGVNGTFIVFSSSIEEVRRVLGRAVASGTRKLSEEYEAYDGGSDRLVITSIDNRPHLICDRST